jgi:lipopolysaccharide/colanic/teichoic acid biosynthesis glycosyltransferase
VKILVVHQFYLQPGEPGGSRFNELARLWSEAGHEVTVVAGTVNYNTSKAPAKYRGRWTTRERDGDVTVWRCHVPESYGKSYLGRMWAFFAFTLAAATAVFRCARPDVVIATSPPLTAFIPGWLAARWHRARLIFEIRDLWPESAVTMGVLREKALLTRLLYALERWACRVADRVNVLTPAFRENLLRRHLAPADRIVFIPNGADLDLFRPSPGSPEARAELGWGDRFVVMYSGAHGRANAIGQLVEAAARLRDRPDILIASVGDGPERQRHAEDARGRGLENIVFMGPQAKERMPALVNACDVGAAVLAANPTFRTVYPNKVFDYMACAKPTLLAIDGVARQLVCDEARAGVFAEPEDADALAAAIKRLADDPAGRAEMGRRGREWVLANAGRDALAERYLGVMRELAARPGRQRGAALFAKVAFDRSAALVGLVVTAPLLAAVALAIRVLTGGPALFRQVRPGLHGRLFEVVKFRTMRDACGADGRPLPDAERLTRLGRFLRASSLDELPQLWNVLRGDLSLVGPRPLLVQYLERYSSRQAYRHEVLPGITGWAQVNGRNAISWSEKLELDAWYAEHWSLLLDLRILWLTVLRVLRRDGISRVGHATMPEFTGSADGAPGGAP